MDASGFVYHTPAGIKPESDLDPGQDTAPATGREELEAAVKRARAIVDGANRYLLKMHGQMKDQANEAMESAREEGYLRGYAEGQAQAMMENEQKLAQIAALLQEIDQGKEEVFRQHEQDMVGLALDIARKVVDCKLQESDTAFMNIYRKAAESLQGQRTVHLQVSGHELSFVTGSSEYLKSLIRGAERIDIEVLADAEPGTCILETEEAVVDASVSKQLERLEQAVMAARG